MNITHDCVKKTERSSLDYLLIVMSDTVHLVSVFRCDREYSSTELRVEVQNHSDVDLANRIEWVLEIRDTTSAGWVLFWINGPPDLIYTAYPLPRRRCSLVVSNDDTGEVKTIVLSRKVTVVGTPIQSTHD